jgi:chromatin remodeling complex protein RSC6
MPRQSKSKTEVVETTPAVNTPVVEQVAAVSTTATEKAVKAKKESKPKAVKSEAAPVVADASAAPVVVDAAEADAADLAAQSTEFLAKLNQLGALLASLKTEYRSLEKKWSREIKTAQKSQAKRKRKSGNRAPSGFVKPTRISDELAKFLDKPIGSEMARTDVTKDINAYIRANKLQNASNGRIIIPDKKLASLLKIKQNEELTYFNLQKFMSIHFAKAGAKVTPELVAGGGVSTSA